jgi:hypothetical protein
VTCVDWIADRSEKKRLYVDDSKRTLCVGTPTPGVLAKEAGFI